MIYNSVNNKILYLFILYKIINILCSTIYIVKLLFFLMFH